MLSYALAIAVAISSLILFSTAFLMSKIHRKDDFLWSAVGLFYALILWFDARNITGTVLLGQAAATVLITSYCWQTIKLRKAIANPAQATETNNFSVVRSFNGLFKRQKPKFEPAPQPVVKPPAPKVTEQDIAIPKTPVATSPQTSETAMQTTTPTVERSAKSDRVIPDPQPTPENKENLEQTSKPTTESQPLPNKLPEVVPQPQPETNIVPPTEQENKQIAKAVEDIQPQAKIEPTTDNIPQPIEPTPEVTTSETAPESSLDSLETVEVAEVLEAEIDGGVNVRESDRDNIIEVTTTDVNIVTETIKIDRNKASNSDPQDV